MAIRIDYSPIEDLVGLAAAAGRGAARRQQEAGDIAYTQMILGTQARFAETAARLQAGDRAFALQKAAAERMVRTPTTRAVVSGPIATEMIRAQRSEQQLEQLETMRGEMSEADYQRSRLNIMADREIVKPRRPAKPAISTTQQLDYWRDRWDRELKPMQRRIQQLRKEITTPYNVLDEEGEIVPGLQAQEAHRTQALGKQLRELEATEAEMLQRQDQEWGQMQQAQITPMATGAAREVARAAPQVQPSYAPEPMPARQAELVPGKVYIASDGTKNRWDGTNFTEIR